MSWIRVLFKSAFFMSMELLLSLAWLQWYIRCKSRSLPKLQVWFYKFRILKTDISFWQILCGVVICLMIARLASARLNMRRRHRAHNLDRRYRIAPHLTTRGNCDSGPTHSRLAHLWSKLQFHLSMLHNGTLHGVNDSYCQGNNQCKKFVILQLFKSCVGEQLPPKEEVVCPQKLSPVGRGLSLTIKSKIARSHKPPSWFITGWVTI